MTRPPRRPSLSAIASLLRSRTLAVWTLAALLLWCVAGTAIPRDAGWAAWASANPGAARAVVALGLRHPFSAAPFLAVAAILGASSLICAFDRLRHALRAFSRSRAVSDDVRERLAARPVWTSRPLPEPEARAALALAFRSAGLRMRTDDGVTVGARFAFAVFGSPIFHFSLVALLILVALGQLTRSDGLIGVARGQSATLDPGSYGVLDTGPLYRPRNTDVSLRLAGFDLDAEAEGRPVGFVPTVELYRGTARVASGGVRPNSPLRSGSLMIHRIEYGLSFGLTGLGEDGSTRGSATEITDFSEETSAGTEPVGFAFKPAGAAAEAVFATVTVLADRAGPTLTRARPKDPRALVEWRSGTASGREMLRVGAHVPIPGGSLRLDSVDYYARLRVVDDWSVSWIYAFFALGVAGLAATVLTPARSAWAALIPDAEGVVRVSVVIGRNRWDPGAAAIIKEELASAFAPSA